MKLNICDVIDVNLRIYIQSITVKKYPANISLSCLICLVGALQGVAVAVTVERRASAWAVGWDSRLLAPLYSVSFIQCNGNTTC